MEALTVKAGVRDGRGLRNGQGQHLHFIDGETKADQVPGFIPALYVEIYLVFYLLLTYTYMDRQIYPNWENLVLAA